MEALGGRWLLRYLAVATLLAAIIVARRPDAVTHPQFWAEDGYVFFYENLTLGFPRALAKLYRGYPYLTHRLIAFAGGVVPLAWAPRVYTTSAIVITALGLASFALPAFRHLVRSDTLRVLFGVAIVSAPFDREVLATPTNLGWFLAVFLSLLSLAPLPRKPWQVGLLALGGSVLVASTPLAAINLPFWLLRAWRGARRAVRREVVFSLLLTAVFAVIAVCTKGAGARAIALPDDHGFGLLYGYAMFPWAVLRAMRYTVASYVLPPDLMTRLDAAGALAVAGLTGFVIVVLFALCASGGWRTLPALLTAIALFAMYFLLLLLGRPRLFMIFAMWKSWGRVPDRYMIFPTAVFVLAVVAALDGVPAGRARRAILVGIVALFVWSWSPLFRVRPLPDIDWPLWAARLEQKLERGSHAPLTIPGNPPWAPIRFDRLDVVHEHRATQRQILGWLGPQGFFSQQFVSRCERLSGVELELGVAVRARRGAVRMTLVDDAGRLLADDEIPLGDLLRGGSWQGFYFEPVDGSMGKHYTLVLQVVDTDARSSIYVVGGRGDPYPHGEAASSAAAVDGDASFRYGCAPATE